MKKEEERIKSKSEQKRIRLTKSLEQKLAYIY